MLHRNEEHGATILPPTNNKEDVFIHKAVELYGTNRIKFWPMTASAMISPGVQEDLLLYVKLVKCIMPRSTEER